MLITLTKARQSQYNSSMFWLTRGKVALMSRVTPLGLIARHLTGFMIRFKAYQGEERDGESELVLSG